MINFHKNLRKYLLERKENSEPKIPIDVIEFLIQEYATEINPKVSLRYGYFDFNEFNNKKMTNDFSHYIMSANMLLINVNEAKNKFKIVVNSILHEIHHFNQHMNWEMDDKFKDNFVKGKKLPPGIGPWDIYELSFIKLVSFWYKIYGYEESPIEIEAWEWARNHTQEAIDKILAKEKSLKTEVSQKHAKKLGDKLNVDWEKVDINQFKMGIEVEKEHGQGPTSIVKSDGIKYAKIALAHLNEIPDYYTRLNKMEKDAKNNIKK